MSGGRNPKGRSRMRNGYRVLDVDAHVTPSMEVLYRYASKELKDRWDELKP